MDSEPVLAAATAASIEITPERPQPHKWLVAAAVLLGAILTILDGSIVNVALPYMQRTFGVGVDRISWVVTSYLAAVSVMIPMSGWIAVRIGRRRYLLISVVLFVTASALCGLAQSIGQMVVFRVIQVSVIQPPRVGPITGAAIIPIPKVVIASVCSSTGDVSSRIACDNGIIAAPAVPWSWRWNFYINVPTGAFAASMVYAYVHDPGYLRDQRGSGRVDYAGIILIAASLGLFQIVLGRGGHDGWFAAPWVRYGAALSALSMVALGTSIDEVRRTEASCDLNRKRRAVAAPPVGNAAITNSAKPAAVDRHRRAADVRAAVDGGRLAGDAGATTSGSRSARLQTDQRAKTTTWIEPRVAREHTALNRKTLDFSPLSEFSIGTVLNSKC